MHEKIEIILCLATCGCESFPGILERVVGGLFLARSIHELFLYGEHFGKVVQKYVQ